MSDKVNARIESAMEVKAYLQNLKYALVNGAQINFQTKRLVDDNRDERYTNQYTVNTLFTDENPIEKRIIIFKCGRLYSDSKRYSVPKKK